MPSLFGDVTFISAFIAVAASIFLGALIYFKGDSGPSRRFFVLSTIALVLWTIANYFSLQPSPYMLIWARIVLMVAVFLQLMFFFLVQVFPDEELKMPKFAHAGIWILSIVTIIATQTPFVFKYIDANGAPIPGSLIPLFGITILLLFILGGRQLILKLKIATGLRRAQMVYVATGYFLMFALLILTQFVATALLHITFFIKFGPIFTLPFLILTAYAIFRHQLFNIRVIATETFTFLVILIFLINVLTSPTPREFSVNSILFIFVTIFGISLIRGTLREIRELQKISDLKSEFISIASHQLRTPLTAIKGYLSMVIDGDYGKIDINANDALKKVYSSNEVLIGLVKDLLDVSRIERGEFHYVFQKICIPDMIDSIVDEQKISAESKGLKLIWHHPENAVRFCVKADDSKLRQVILNLIDNAIKYTPRGSVEVSVTQLYNNPLRMRISVKDTGIGITEADKEKLFQRFSRGEGGKKIDVNGTGLGLFIVKRIVEDHGGTAWVESEGEGKGSTFIVSLPFYRNE
ncbi:MAG: hypothetical protein HYV65_00270 [Candidatus Spechtbacteria bacterium]|nr:hypothetical protein [Candidatus Spechtbacteria bacterium]